MKKNINRKKVSGTIMPLLMAFLMGLALFGFSGSNVYAATDGDFDFNIVDGSAEITGYTGVGGAVDIPETVFLDTTAYSVTSIGAQAFYDTSSLTSVTIPSSVTSIGDSAFYLCGNLQYAYFKGNAPVLGNSVFRSESDFLVRYISGNTGFTNPWYGYSTEAVEVFYTVVFDSQGGSGVESQSVSHNNTITEPTAPTKTGYTFGGWYKESTCDNAWTFAADYVIADTTLYANWTATPYTITYEIDGGDNDVLNPATYNIESETITLGDPTKTGHTFAGWYDNAGFTGDVVTTIPTGSTGDITLYAKWTINQYTVTFNSQGGSSVDPVATDYDTTITAPGEPPRTGYTFAGWFKESTCDNEWTFASDAVIVPITLYAKWIPNTYTIKFHSNGGTGTMAALTMTYDTTKALTANAFKKIAYRFLGWATTSTGPVVYKDLTAIKNLSSTNGATVTLYAKWGVPITGVASYSYTSIRVTWAAVGSATAYKVYRSTSAAGTYSLVYTGVSTARSWVNTGLSTGRTYYYKVYPVAGGVIYKNSTYMASRPIPATPTTTLTKYSSTTIKITWTGVAGATRYQIYRANSLNGTYSLVYTATSTARWWYNTGRTAGATYYYKVRAYHLEGIYYVYGNFSAVKSLKI